MPKYPKDGKTCQKMAKVAKRWQMLPKVWDPKEIPIVGKSCLRCQKTPKVVKNSKQLPKDGKSCQKIVKSWRDDVMIWHEDIWYDDGMTRWRDGVMTWWHDDMMSWCQLDMMSWWYDMMTWWRDDTMTWSYILKVGVPGDRVSANFVHFPPKFRLRKQKPSRPHCTNASPSFCRRWFVFNINTSHIDLLFLTNWRWKTRICVIYAFLSHFFVAIHAFFPPNRLRQFIHFKNVWTWCHDVMMTWRHDDMVLDPWSWSYAFCLMYTGLNAPNFETTTGPLTH